MKLSIIKFLGLVSTTLLVSCQNNLTVSSFDSHKEIDAVKKSGFNLLANRALNTLHLRKPTTNHKCIAIDYLQNSCDEILKKNAHLQQTLKRMSKLSSTSQNAYIFNDLTLMALNKNLLAHASYKIFIQDPEISKNGYENFLKGLNSLNNVKHPVLRKLSIEIAAQETENLAKKATRLKHSFKPDFESDVFSLGCRLEQQENY
jgi:hypothetical protein